MIDARAVAHLEGAVADLAPRAQEGAHLHDRIVVLPFELDPAGLFALAAHQDPEIGQFIHRPDCEPAAPFEELAPLVGERRPVVDGVVGNTAVEHQVVGPGDDHERVELEVLHRPHRCAGTGQAAPTTAGPQAATTHHVAAGGERRDVEHRQSLADRFDRPRRTRVVPAAP